MRLIRLIPIYIVSILLVLACDPFKTPDLEISKHTVKISNVIGEEFNVTVMSVNTWKSEISYTSTDDKSWLMVSPAVGKEGTAVLTITVTTSNNTNSIRKAAIAISNKKLTDTIYVTQDIVNISIPDINFKGYLVEKFDLNNDREISDYEQGLITRIDCSNRNIEKLDGIEQLETLVSLNCSHNNIDTLDITGVKNITMLNCDYNLLECLIIDSLPKLYELSCSHNNLTELNFTKCSKLTSVSFAYNPIKVINVSHCTSLKIFNSSQYAIPTIETINATGCSNLTEIDCSNSRVSTLITKGCNKLSKLDCSSNNLTSLDISESPSMTELRCNSNKIQSLYIGVANYLKVLYCADNRIESLDLEGCSLLEELWCVDNNRLKIITLAKKPSVLYYYGEWGNPIEHEREYFNSSDYYVLYYYYYPKIYINGVFSSTLYNKIVFL